MAAFTNETAKKFITFVESNTKKAIQTALAGLAQKLPNKVRETFDKKGARGDNPAWPITNNPTPLIKTRALYNSFKGYVNPKNKSPEVVIYTKIPYASVHQEGKGVTQRKFMFVTNEDIGSIKEAFDKALEVDR